MIVCHCARVTDRDIDHLIAEGATTVGEITRRCGAGRCCAPCRAGIQELLSGVCTDGCLAEAAA